MLSFKGFKAKDLCDPAPRPDPTDILESGGMRHAWVVVALAARSCRLGEPRVCHRTRLLPSKVAVLDGARQRASSWSILQGGPSHLDLWDPKENVPDNVKSVFGNISTKIAWHSVHGESSQAEPDQ